MTRHRLTIAQANKLARDRALAAHTPEQIAAARTRLCVTCAANLACMAEWNLVPIMLDGQDCPYWRQFNQPPPTQS